MQVVCESSEVLIDKDLVIFAFMFSINLDPFMLS